ncbi:hypothetical protein Q4F19_02780 [Sphingomonas sp. BIUV-7]|uniref:Uncharacterized protein n=1 Tax=Sphingomonas natans TaxID=3063330 RepID=A0ABT8Y4P7_9SPHN|nr:hypothetical protein [Sphingomonas sp. BIUV-7]MDO6413297.1 hypothetical protein [Sphingomonas sp. BIUV-7]
MTTSLLLFLALAAADPTTGTAGAPPAPARVATAEKSADATDKVICKKFLETGSLVKGYRVCKTKAEWQQGRDDVRKTMTMTGQMSCASGNGGACFQ